eukprot:CAMPEP_0118668190 /NCGR_PEP_ID=MMETSP0785-20121206/20210_1 /TAXON_ID=91992 /ORGANISM="Bolidomonas pacifica, Strain CCMP 1866" /LENGTH=61 /DNA_ID=CAMNT_0006562739 /DNA_START=384 /DNA_END=566 /DNA_ORIENTATION=-
MAESTTQSDSEGSCDLYGDISTSVLPVGTIHALQCGDFTDNHETNHETNHMEGEGLKKHKK